MLFEKLQLEPGDLHPEMVGVLRYLTGVRNTQMKKNPGLHLSDYEDIEMIVFMEASKLLERWDATKSKFITMLYSQLGFRVTEEVGFMRTGIRLKRRDFQKHKKETGENLNLSIIQYGGVLHKHLVGEI